MAKHGRNIAGIHSSQHRAGSGKFSLLHKLHQRGFYDLKPFKHGVPPLLEMTPSRAGPPQAGISTSTGYLGTACVHEFPSFVFYTFPILLPNARRVNLDGKLSLD
jgi:hypothetical protein